MKYFQLPTENVTAKWLIIFLFFLGYFTVVSVAQATRRLMLG
jgi:hypothetical protein